MAATFDPYVKQLERQSTLIKALHRALEAGNYNSTTVTEMSELESCKTCHGEGKTRNNPPKPKPADKMGLLAKVFGWFAAMGLLCLSLPFLGAAIGSGFGLFVCTVSGYKDDPSFARLWGAGIVSLGSLMPTGIGIMTAFDAAEREYNRIRTLD